MAATISVLTLFTCRECGYDRTHAAQDFDRIARAGYGSELVDVLAERLLPHVLSQCEGVDVCLDDVVDTFTRAHEQALVKFRDPLPQVLSRGRMVTPNHLDVVIEEARGEGWDAARIADAVVYLESANHQGLVLLSAGRIARNRPHGSEEYVAYGWIGLRTALLKFEPALGNRFSTYAVLKITGAIRDGERDEDPLPKRLVTDRNKAAKATAQLADALGRTPTLAEVSAEIGDKLASMLPRLGRAASLEELESTFTIVDSSDVHADVEKSQLKEAVDAALSDLDDHTRELADKVFRQELPIKQVAAESGLSERDVHHALSHAREVLSGSLVAWA